MSEFSKPHTRIEQTFYPNGRLETVTPYVGDKVCGVVRRWHENGVMQSEVPKNGPEIHGTVREWDVDGRLTGQGEFENGVGVFQTYYADGQLKGEVYARDGVAHGRLRAWDESGELLGEQFFISGRRVSKKKYQEACSKDPSLPRYDADDVQVPLSERCFEPPVEQHIMSADDYEDARDALEWLKGSTEQAVRTIGELPTADDSIALVREFLEGGAVRVLAIHIEMQDDAGSENTGQLLIELPSEAASRQKALELCNEQNRSCGYGTIKDTGQRYVQVALD